MNAVKDESRKYEGTNTQKPMTTNKGRTENPMTEAKTTVTTKTKVSTMTVTLIPTTTNPATETETHKQQWQQYIHD